MPYSPNDVNRLLPALSKLGEVNVCVSAGAGVSVSKLYTFDFTLRVGFFKAVGCHFVFVC